MTQGPGASLIPQRNLTLSEILSGSFNCLRRMPKTLLGIGLFSGFIIGISNIMTSALVVKSGESLILPEIPNPASVITQEQIEELVNALAPTLKVGLITSLALFFVQAISAGMFIVGKNSTTIRSNCRTFSGFIFISYNFYCFRSTYWSCA